ncbi:hypothetical protein NEDG_02088 [Nematocida displodere]|uniref:Uncharacterized protein n=1 Tax=Nematocida displodere TaxID=1805483 RepID=A0A177EMF9_9MICR|nr:hypothetical protein NEDG_02088 [Nematocida displodere]
MAPMASMPVPGATINWLPKKDVSGYLYNRGTKVFVSYNTSTDHFAAKSGHRNQPTVFGLPMRREGSVVALDLMLLEVASSLENFQMHEGKHYIFPGHIFAPGRRISDSESSGRPLTTKVGSWSGKTQIIMTMPYYQNDTAFKMILASSQKCISVNEDGFLIKETCVTDKANDPTPENDQQLFTWCPINHPDSCM